MFIIQDSAGPQTSFHITIIVELSGYEGLVPLTVIGKFLIVTIGAPAD